MMYTIILYSAVTLIAWLAVYLDSKLLDNKHKRITYVKVILLCNLLVFLSIKFLSTLSGNNTLPVDDLSKVVGGKVVYAPEIGEPMLAGSLE